MFAMLKTSLKSAMRENPACYKLFGYNTQRNFEAMAAKFLACESLCEWLGASHYDLVNTTKSFALRLGQFGDAKMWRVQLTRAEIEMRTYSALRQSYIRVTTGFRRGDSSLPLFALACYQHTLYLGFVDSKRWMRFSEETILRLVARKIKRHYKRNDGKLKVWGQITGYELHLNRNGWRVRHFSVDGRLLRTGGIDTHFRVCLRFR